MSVCEWVYFCISVCVCVDVSMVCVRVYMYVTILQSRSCKKSQGKKLKFCARPFFARFFELTKIDSRKEVEDQKMKEADRKIFSKL